MSWLTQRFLKSPEGRRQKVQELIADGSSEAIEALAGYLQDPHPEIREATLKGLGKLRARDSVAAIAEALHDSEPKIRELAAQVLGQIGDTAATDALVETLGDDFAHVRQRAAKTLDSFGWKPKTKEEKIVYRIAQGDFAAAAAEGPDALELLISLLGHEQMPDRHLIVEGLAGIKSDRLIGVLQGLFQDGDARVRTAAAEVLGKLNDTANLGLFLTAMKDEAPTVRTTAAIVLGRLGDPQALEELSAALQDSNWGVRKAAVEALGRLKHPDGVPPLCELLEDADYDVRQAAVQALGEIGDKRAVEKLIVALVDPQTSVRKAAADALKKVEPNWENSEGAIQAVPLLKEALDSREYWVRYAASDVLKRIEGAQKPQPASEPTPAPAPEFHKQLAALDALLPALHDSDRDLRLAAVEALGRIGDPRAIEPLAACQGDADQWVRKSVSRSIEILKARRRAQANAR